MVPPHARTLFNRQPVTLVSLMGIINGMSGRYCPFIQSFGDFVDYLITDIKMVVPVGFKPTYFAV